MTERDNGERDGSEIPAHMRGLNERQLEAVLAKPGPLRIAAGPGSGKTKTVISRITELILRGANPSRILAVTFTKSAAEEMRSRLEASLGPRAKGVRLGTFHATAAYILRRMIGPEEVGLTKKFTIWDEHDRKAAVRDVLREIKVEDARRRCEAGTADDEDAKAVRTGKAKVSVADLNRALAVIEDARGLRLGPRQVEEIAAVGPVEREAFRRYEERLAKADAVDFGLILCKALDLSESIRTGPVLAGLFDHVFVDEFQDADFVQVQLAYFLSRARRSITVVGDGDQCIPFGETVGIFKDGVVKRIPIEKVRSGMLIESCCGSRVVPRKVLSVSTTKKDVALEFKTATGRIFRATPEHVLFSSLGTCVGAFVYLMWKEHYGFRIGITRVNEKGGGRVSIRSQQEHAERMWIIGQYDTRDEAARVEYRFAYRYRVPMLPFVVRGDMNYTQEHIFGVFREFGHGGEELLFASGQDFDHPAYLSKSTGRGRVAVNLMLAGEKGCGVIVESSNVNIGAQREFGFVRGRRTTMRLRRFFPDPVVAKEFAKKVAERCGGYVAEGLFISGSARRVFAVRAAGLFPGMLVPEDDGSGCVRMVPVVSRNIVMCAGCRDLKIQGTANFLVNGVVVHNSLYQWRGAHRSAFLNFTREWGEATKTILLEQNYRSSKNVVKAAKVVIAGNPGRIETTIFTEADLGHPVRVVGVENSISEADFIMASAKSLIRDGVSPGEIAVFHRSKGLYRDLEKALRQARIRYRIVKGVRFYDRKAVKNALCWMRLAVNRRDDAALARVANLPARGVSDRLLTSAAAWAKAHRTCLADALEAVVAGKVPDAPRGSGNGAASLLAILERISAHVASDAATASSTLAVCLEASGYAAWLAKLAVESTANEAEAEVADSGEDVDLVDDDEEDDDAELTGAEKARSEAKKSVSWLAELLGDMAAYEQNAEDKSAAGFLEQAALMSEEDRNQRHNAVQIMTVHASKGREFDHVFVIGMEEGVFPSYRSMVEVPSDERRAMRAMAGREDDSRDGGRAIDEEQRLCYVAITRARKQATLIHARERFINGEYKHGEASRYIKMLVEAGACEVHGIEPRFVESTVERQPYQLQQHPWEP